MKCKCKSCGEEFDFDEAADEFNAHFEDSYDYAYNGWEGFCADCAISEQERIDEDGDGFFDDLN